MVRLKSTTWLSLRLVLQGLNSVAFIKSWRKRVRQCTSHRDSVFVPPFRWEKPLKTWLRSMKSRENEQTASWSRGSFWWHRQLSFICKTSYGRHRTQWHKPFEKREGREITGSLETYRNKRKKRKDKVKVILCVAILESLMLYYMRSGPDGDVGRILVAGVMWISHTAFKYESKDVVPVLLFLLEASHPHNIVNHPATHKKSSKQQCPTRPQSTASHLTKQLMRIQAVS